MLSAACGITAREGRSTWIRCCVSTALPNWPACAMAAAAAYRLRRLDPDGPRLHRRPLDISPGDRRDLGQGLGPGRGADPAGRKATASAALDAVGAGLGA